MDEYPDVIVKWKDGTVNCVSTKELKSVVKSAEINCVGTKVKMFYKKRWYFGTVVTTELSASSQNIQSSQPLNTNDENSSDDDFSNLAKRQNVELSDGEAEDPFRDYDVEDPDDPDFVIPSIRPRKASLSSNATVCIEDEPTLCDEININTSSLQSIQPIIPQYEKPNMIETHRQQTCEVLGCNEEVFSACVRCLILQCWEHFITDAPCNDHSTRFQPRRASLSSNATVCIEDEPTLCDEININASSLQSIQPIIPQYEKPNMIETHRQQTCEVLGCNEEVFSACVRCLILQCWEHFITDAPCNDHSTRSQSESPSILSSINIPEPAMPLPESFEVEGAPKEAPTSKKQTNKKKDNTQLKNLGKEYLTQVKKKVVPERRLGPTCNLDSCERKSLSCHRLAPEDREKIFEEYWKLGNVDRQREFIARHVEQITTQRQTAGPTSRRQVTIKYYLMVRGERFKVCGYFFLNTLSISQRALRTALAKVTPVGTMEKDNRGGRTKDREETDSKLRELVESHIDRFPRVESHYCRENSSREYLHADLSLRKMYDMFLATLENDAIKPCFTTYRRVFKAKNLSFHHPKKDQCSLCMAYHTGNSEDKLKLQEKYDNHIEQKKLFREKRTECKELAKQSPDSIQCATFDLQQVISLPKTNESSLFYKRRLSAYNFTIYDMTSRACTCFTWHEAQSKRGSSEISTALNIHLKDSDVRGLKHVYLFADGCSGQNRNSIVASALLYTINNATNLEEITLQFSVPNHGQNEGDSAHSAIGYALKKAGDVFVPSQLVPIYKLSRRSQPYDVVVLSHTDFLNFKKLSTDLRLLSVRSDNEGLPINWTEMTAFHVRKTDPTTLYFKTDHRQTSNRSLSLKRQRSSFLNDELSRLNDAPRKIVKEKYDDLISLTAGDAPVIRLPEHAEFYKSLPH